MVSTIEVARGALALTGKNVDQGYWNGRNVTHWSTHLAMTGALIGAIAFVAGIAFDSIVIASLGGLLLVNNGISAYYLKKFSVFNSIDEVIRALALTVKELYDQVVALHEHIEVLEPATQRITDERIKIEARLKESTAVIEKLKGVEKKYEEVSKKLTAITNIYNPLKGAVDNFIRKVSELENYKLDFSKLSLALKELANERSQLEGSIKLIDDGTKKLDTHEKKIGDLSTQLGTLIDRWNANFQELQKQIVKLEEENDELQHALHSLTTENLKAEAIVKRAESLRAAFPKAAEWKALIEELKKNS